MHDMFALILSNVHCALDLARLLLIKRRKKKDYSVGWSGYTPYIMLKSFLTYMRINISMSVTTSTCACMHVYVSLCVYVCVSVCMCVGVYVWVCVCVWVTLLCRSVKSCLFRFDVGSCVQQGVTQTSQLVSIVDFYQGHILPDLQSTESECPQVVFVSKLPALGTSAWFALGDKACSVAKPFSPSPPIASFIVVFKTGIFLD